MISSSADNRRTAGTRPGEEPSTTLRDALWLVGKDIRASWLSYPATVVVSFLFGLLGAVQFGSALSGDTGKFGEFVLDLYLVCVVPVLSTNLIFNRDYYATAKMEGFDERLSFLRGLPIRGRAVIAGRTVCALVSLAFAAPSFFLVPYLVSGSLRDTVGVAAYLWFCGFWVGYALVLTGGLYIFGSFGFRWDSAKMPPYMAGSILAYILVSVVLNFVFAAGLALTLLQASKSYGPFLAGVPLVVGAVSLVFAARMAESRLERRDVG